jgi:PHD/YefM family antitoxin component YafN of YafNO toxin-antitoxin module
MIKLHPEYIVDEAKNPKAVLIPLAEWESVLTALEDLDDIRAYDEAKRSGGEIVPFEQALWEIERGEVR